MVIEELTTRVFADGADLGTILSLASDPRIRGFTTNPTLMKEAGQSKYSEFARNILAEVTELPVSFEVLADDLEEMGRQAKFISGWGENVYVKIPVTTSSGVTTAPLIRGLSESGIKVNVTAVFTLDQVATVADSLTEETPSFISVFAGRIADAGVDPVPLVAGAVDILNRRSSRAELIWASPREVLNLVQANSVGCHVITMTMELLKKLDCLGKDLEQFSLETVQMFYCDAVAAGLSI